MPQSIPRRELVATPAWRWEQRSTATSRGRSCLPAPLLVPSGVNESGASRCPCSSEAGEGCEQTLPAAVLGRVLVSPVVCFGLELALVQQRQQLRDLL